MTSSLHPRRVGRGAAWASLAILAACSGNVGDGSGPPGQSPPDAGGSTAPNNPSGPRCQEVGPPTLPRLRRLTFAQYDRTVSELVQLELTPSSELGPEVDGVNPVLWAGLETAAASVARRVVTDAAALARLLPCTPSGDGAACAEAAVDALGRRAYRRPLSEAERGRYLALYRDRGTLSERGTFEEGIGLVLEAMLQAPSFLLRVERSVDLENDRVRLSGSEIATRLAYSLWNGPPDEALLTAAERGDLDTAEGVRREATRMLTSPEGEARARGMVRSAHREWLGMVGAYEQFWSNTRRDPELFPEWYEGIDVDYREEVLRFVEHVIFERRGTFGDLFTSPAAVVNARLAPIYGLQGDFSSGWTVVELDPETRPGLLTRAGFVGTHGRYSRGSLIFRGTFVLKKMLCQETGSPPPGAESTPLPDATAELRTTRERVQAMTAGDACRGCHHERINPLGFPLESFDGLGRFRAEEDGVAIDASGSYRFDNKVERWETPRRFAELVGGSNDARACYVKKLAAFTFDEAGVQLGCEGQRLAARLGEPGVTLLDFLVDLVSSPLFTTRSVEEAQ